METGAETLGLFARHGGILGLVIGGLFILLFILVVVVYMINKELKKREAIRFKANHKERMRWADAIENVGNELHSLKEATNTTNSEIKNLSTKTEENTNKVVTSIDSLRKDGLEMIQQMIRRNANT